MIVKPLLAGLAALSLTASSFAQAPAPAAEAFSADAFRAHVTFLADDLLEGRDTGSRGYEIAARYVATQFAALGLQPAGPNGSWYQPVNFIRYRSSPNGSITVGNHNFALGRDAVMRASPDPAALAVDAPLVFAGYGLDMPSHDFDDYRGLDVRGKIVAVLYSGPKGLNGEVAAHLGNRLDRARLAKARGAVGILYLWTSQIESVLPFAMMTRSWDSKVMAWANPDGSERDLGAPALGVVGFSGAEKLFAGSKIRWSDVRSADDAGRKLPTGPLAVTAHARQSFIVERQPSSNVVGRLPGSDRAALQCAPMRGPRARPAPRRRACRART